MKRGNMKNLYRKEKVHPSPAGGGRASIHKNGICVVPAAIATLSAALLPEEQEVLAYLIHIASSSSYSPLHHNASRKSSSPLSQGRKESDHTPTFGCCCFQCYVTFWSRWDASPNRELIHKAIDLFEEHMAAATSKGKIKNRKASSKAAAHSNDNDKEEKTSTINNVAGREEERKGGFDKEEDGVRTSSASEDFQARANADHGIPIPMGRRSLVRRVFPDIMSFLAEHLWTVWSPPV